MKHIDSRYILRPEISRIIININARTSRRYSSGPRANATKPINQSITSIAAATKSKSNNPIYKTSKIKIII